MTSFAARVLAQVLCVQVDLYACRERLAAATDAEALHDLRIALRKLRSLLQPLRGLPACDGLRSQAAEVGRRSGPLRDLEVLLAHLPRLGMRAAVDRRQSRLLAGYAALLADDALPGLFEALDQWPQSWRQAAAEAELAGLAKRVKRRLSKQQWRLAEALVEPAHDRHRLRLLIKRVRYGAEAYAQLSGLSGKTLARLKTAQSALGNWHDLQQWLQRAEQEADLAACVDTWRTALQAAEEAADRALLALQADFPSAG
ncbi:CHAD domain-containing protein [Pseudomonas sp. sp1636]|uniref:CHAD domain-containing protein n=1 Tax=Pseudomonas sp. sp1636 TaxID=3036707 RepID=UPI0025A52565|nr:CHAD domain-containing protein [Pseudomonas sp. sp1636]MDM8349913.1 CHAD domain-containing protein [Pseudomonas sp. sp1636]